MTDRKPPDDSKESLQYDCGGCIIEIDSLLEGRFNKNVADGEVYDIHTDDLHLTLLIRHASGGVGQIFTFDGKDIQLTHKEGIISFKYNAALQAFEEIFPSQRKPSPQLPDAGSDQDCEQMQAYVEMMLLLYK
jgi:hypothetical protein